MVLSRTAPRWESTEYARLEYPCEDLRVLAAGWAAGPEPGPSEPSAIGGWVVRAAAWLRGRAEEGADRPFGADPAAEAALAALPARESGASAEGAPAPVWAIPALTRVPPEHPA